MKKRVIAFLMAVIMLLCLSVSAYAAPTDGKTLRHGVVRIFVGVEISHGIWSQADWYPLGAGTGFFVGDAGKNPEYLLTNRHVIEDYIMQEQGEPLNVTVDGSYEIGRVQIRVYFDSNDYVQAYVVAYGETESKDFAILRLDEPTSKRAALPLCIPTVDMSDPNETVTTVGFPGAADNEALKSVSQTGEGDATLSTGIISKLYTMDSTGVQVIYTTAEISHGNSGGPLVFSNGGVIGITTWGYSEDGRDMYYAVGMKTIEPYLARYNVPYTLVGANDTAKAAEKTEEVDDEDEEIEEEKDWHDYIVYGILGLAILGVIVVLLILLIKPKKKAQKNIEKSVSDGTVPGPMGGVSGGVRGGTAPQGGSNVEKRVLIGVEGPLAGKRFEIKTGESLCIGRDKKKCKVVFPEGTPGVSAVHCMIHFDGRTATINDMNSSYGTAVDGTKLTPNAWTTLHRGLPIDIGSKHNRFVLQ